MLHDLARLRTGKTGRCSSWAADGRNRDSWRIAPGETAVLAVALGSLATGTGTGFAKATSSTCASTPSTAATAGGAATCTARWSCRPWRTYT